MSIIVPFVPPRSFMVKIRTGNALTAPYFLIGASSDLSDQNAPPAPMWLIKKLLDSCYNTIGQLLFAHWATQPSILSGSVNEYRL